MSAKLCEQPDNCLRQSMTWRSTLFLPLFVFLSFVASCTVEQEHTAPAVNDRDSASMMVSYGVNTLISDSGVIKYRIVTERWDVNTVRHPSRWEFIKGIFFEQFDEQFHIQAYIQADTAWYYDQKKLWKLRGRVRIRNINGLVYTSEELFWDGIRHELYSHVFSKVVTPERTLQGTYFLSDERMTRYTVSNSKGSFVSEDMTGEKSDDSNAETSADSLQQQAPMRPQATKRAKTVQP